MRKRRSIHEHKQLNKQLGLVAGSLLACAAVVWAAAIVAINAQQPMVVEDPEVYTIAAPEVTETVVEPSGILLPRRTNGELADATEANAQPIAIMIENAAFGGVRPQFGLSRAEIVYEMMVEGGITRFMAIYSGNTLPEKIGPVRSARPTYLEYVAEYDALYAHAGGSPEALAAISGLEVKDLNALEAGGPYFERDNSRSAPHNLFTSQELLIAAINAQQLQTVQSTFDSWSFVDGSAPEELNTPDSEENIFATSEPDSLEESEPNTDTIDTISIDYGSGPLYTVEYRYDAVSNRYVRYNGGERQIDANTGEDLQVATIIVQRVEEGVEVDGSRVNFNVTGSGAVTIFHDGRAYEGTWNKDDRTSRTRFIDAEGKEISLRAGPIWIAILPPESTLDY